MTSRQTAKIAFASALVLLLLCGVAALTAILRFSNSVEWVAHTYEVQFATGEVESTLSEAARDRLSYVTSGEESYLPQFEAARKQVSVDLSRVRQLTIDNPTQQDLFARLETLANQRLGLLQTSIDARKTQQPAEGLQQKISVQNTSLATDIAGVIDQMQAHADLLLKSRKQESSSLYAAVLWVLGVLLACAVFLFWVYYRLLRDELRKREQAESGARRLSAHVLELQDEERRKFSRELHDSIGQTLSVAKMIAYSAVERQPGDKSLPELLAILDRCIQETRTISHLLHPPLLDELGIAAAVSWYVDGFSQRSGLRVNLKISEKVGRLSRPVELVLFRVLQESLANVHSHSNSAKADVALYVADGSAVLQVRDYGIGIPAEKLDHFRSDGTQVGVGLTGMRERVREQGGQFEIYSDKTGTEVLVTVPLDSARYAAGEAAAEMDRHANAEKETRTKGKGAAGIAPTEDFQ